MSESLFSRFRAWLAANPFVWILVVTVALYALARYVGIGYLTGTAWLHEPIYRPVSMGLTFLTKGVAEVPGYMYALVARALPSPVVMASWPSTVFGLCLLGFWSVLLGCVSFISTTSTYDKVRFWVITAIITALAAFLVRDAVAGSQEVGLGIRFYCILVNAGLFYGFSQLLPRVTWVKRCMCLFLGNLAWFVSLYFLGKGWEAYLLWAGYASVVPLVLSCLFAFQVAYFLPYGALLLAVRQNVNGVFAYVLILLFTVGNVLLAYLESRGLYKGALFSVDGIWLLAALALLGLDAYQRFVDEGCNWFTHTYLAKPVLAAWGGVTFSFLAWAYATENGPLVEVIEDTTNLSIIGVSAGFFMYVLANFGVLLGRRQRVDRVFFSPYQLPISSIMVIAATVIYIFFAGNNKFQYQQGVAGFYNCVADGFFAQKDYQSADLFYLESASNDFYNFHANYMLAQLAKAKGRDKEARDYLDQATYTKAKPEGYLAKAASYKEAGVFIEEVLALTEGRNRFPHDERLQGNLMIAYLGSDLKDSVAILAEGLQKKGSTYGQTNALAAHALGKGTGAMQPVGPVANWYLGTKPKVNICATLSGVQDTATLGSMAGFLALFNGMVLCDAPKTYTKLDTFLPKLEEGYKEDMLYARAWTLWRSGNRLQALEDMITLARPGSYSAQTYYTTAMAWAQEVGNQSLAAKLFTDAKPALPTSVSPIQSPDSSLGRLRYSEVSEAQRAAWVANQSEMAPEQVAALLNDFKNPIHQRAFVWSVLKKSSRPLDMLKATLPQLKGSDDAGIRSLDRILALKAVEHCLAGAVSPAAVIPAKFLSQIQSTLAPVLSLQKGTITAGEAKAVVRLFPFSLGALEALLLKVQKNPRLGEAVFEEVAHAYSLDKENPAIRKTYIRLARQLNLDFFAEAAEKKE